MKKIVLAASALLLLTTACKKKEDAASLVGKWNVSSINEKTTFNGTSTTQNTAGAAGDYVDFRTDGKVYTSFQGQKDTSVYAITDATHVVIDGESNEIRNLTNSSVTLYSNVTYSGYNYETNVNLNR